MEWSTFWGAFGAISTAVTAGSIIYAARQIRFNAWLRAQDVFTEASFTEARKKIFQRTSGAALQPDQETAAWQVCRRMDELARLAPYLGEKAVLEVWDDAFAKLWTKLEDEVKEERKRVKWEKKWSAFEILGRKACAKLQGEGREIA